MYSSGGTKVGYQLTVDQSTKQPKLEFLGAMSFVVVGSAPVVILNQWQLIGFTADLSIDTKTTQGTVFVDTTHNQFYLQDSPSCSTCTPMDLLAAAVMRIGDTIDSINGDISVVRVMVPGGGIIRTTDLCSSESSIELGVGAFALACSGTNVLRLTESKCYAEACTEGTRFEATFSLCVPCPKDHCDTCDTVQCLTCETDYFFYEEECVDSCPDGMYFDGTICQGCPMSCKTCSSDSECQDCNSGYVLLNSFCSIPSSPSPSPPSLHSASKTEAAAAQKVSSAASAIASVASVGTSVVPIVGLVSEAVQNTRYLNLSVTAELTQVYETYSTDLISWNLPNFMTKLNDYKQLEGLFARYDLDSPFLVNFWSTMMTMSLALGILIFCFGCEKFFLKSSKGLLFLLIQKVIAGSINFIVVQAFGSLDNILFYFVLDIKTNPFDSAFSRASLAFGILFIICGTLLMIFSIRVVHKYHMLKREGLAKNDTKEIETFQEKNKYLEVFYGDFNEADLWSHCFLAFLILRSNISSLIITVLYEYPLMQTLFLIIVDGVILLFIVIEKPFTTDRAVFFQYYFEAIILIVHVCCFLLSWSDEPSERLKNGVSSTIIYLNTALVTGGLGLMFIEIQETFFEIKNEWKSIKAQKKSTAAIFPLSEESNVRFQNDSSPGIEARKTENSGGGGDSSSFRLESQRNIFKNNRYHLPGGPQNRRMGMRNRDFYLPE